MNGSRGLTALVWLISSSGQAARGAAAQARPQAQVCGNRETKTERTRDTWTYKTVFPWPALCVCFFFCTTWPRAKATTNKNKKATSIVVIRSLSSSLSIPFSRVPPSLRCFELLFFFTIVVAGVAVPSAFVFFFLGCLHHLVVL